MGKRGENHRDSEAKPKGVNSLLIKPAGVTRWYLLLDTSDAGYVLGVVEPVLVYTGPVNAGQSRTTAIEKKAANSGRPHGASGCAHERAIKDAL